MLRVNQIRLASGGALRAMAMSFLLAGVGCQRSPIDNGPPADAAPAAASPAIATSDATAPALVAKTSEIVPHTSDQLYEASGKNVALDGQLIMASTSIDLLSDVAEIVEVIGVDDYAPYEEAGGSPVPVHGLLTWHWDVRKKSSGKNDLRQTNFTQHEDWYYRKYQISASSLEVLKDADATKADGPPAAVIDLTSKDQYAAALGKRVRVIGKANNHGKANQSVSTPQYTFPVPRFDPPISREESNREVEVQGVLRERRSSNRKHPIYYEFPGVPFEGLRGPGAGTPDGYYLEDVEWKFH